MVPGRQMPRSGGSRSQVNAWGRTYNFLHFHRKWRGVSRTSNSPGVTFFPGNTRPMASIWLSSAGPASCLPTYVAPITGGKPRALTVHSSMSRLAWLPDGKRSYSTPHTRDSLSSGGHPFPGRTRTGRVAGEDAIEPTIAAHGNRLAFQRYAVDTNIWKAPVSPSEHASPVRTIASTKEDSDPAFSPDGKRIAFRSNRSGTDQVYVCGADGSNPLQLTSVKRRDRVSFLVSRRKADRV